MSAEVLVGQVYRDRDKRESGGNRHVRVVAQAVKNGRAAALCERVFKSEPEAPWTALGRFKTTLKWETLLERFELVEDVCARCGDLASEPGAVHGVDCGPCSDESDE